MELLLWRWSTAVQITSAVTIAVFFAVLARSDPRAELRWWVRAWMFNVAALSVTLLYWYLEPPPAILPVVGGAYLAGKTTFVILLLQGAWALVRPGAAWLRPSIVTGAAGLMALLGMSVLTSINLIGVGQHFVMFALLSAGALWLMRERDRGVTWLAAGLAIRAALALVETFAYASQLMPLLSPARTDAANAFLSAHSSLDTGAEWLIALGCVLGVAGRTQGELRANNDRLLAAQEDLRRLVDRDPLTGLDNRRVLPAVLRRVQPTGATLLFFDLDGFKGINDLHGHHIGDECLKHFAGALCECFRPTDTVVRYAGDEFLVIAAGVDRTAIDQRVGQLKWRLRKGVGQIPYFTFSVGVAELPPGGDPEEAIRAADQQMYRTKGMAERAS